MVSIGIVRCATCVVIQYFARLRWVRRIRGVRWPLIQNPNVALRTRPQINSGVLVFTTRITPITVKCCNRRPRFDIAIVSYACPCSPLLGIACHARKLATRGDALTISNNVRVGRLVIRIEKWGYVLAFQVSNIGTLEFVILRRSQAVSGCRGRSSNCSALREKPPNLRHSSARLCAKIHCS